MRKGSSLVGGGRGKGWEREKGGKEEKGSNRRRGNRFKLNHKYSQSQMLLMFQFSKRGYLKNKVWLPSLIQVKCPCKWNDSRGDEVLLNSIFLFRWIVFIKQNTEVVDIMSNMGTKQVQYVTHAVKKWSKVVCGVYQSSSGPLNKMKCGHFSTNYLSLCSINFPCRGIITHRNNSFHLKPFYRRGGAI